MKVIPRALKNIIEHDGDTISITLSKEDIDAIRNFIERRHVGKTYNTLTFMDNIKSDGASLNYEYQTVKELAYYAGCHVNTAYRIFKKAPLTKEDAIHLLEIASKRK